MLIKLYNNHFIDISPLTKEITLCQGAKFIKNLDPKEAVLLIREYDQEKRDNLDFLMSLEQNFYL